MALKQIKFFRDVLTPEDLEGLQASVWLDKFNNIIVYYHATFYYYKESMKRFVKTFNRPKGLTFIGEL